MGEELEQQQDQQQPAEGEDSSMAEWYFDTVACISDDLYSRRVAPRAAAKEPTYIHQNRFAALYDDTDDYSEEEVFTEQWQQPVNRAKGLRGPRPSGQPRKLTTFGSGLGMLLHDSGDSIFSVSSGPSVEERTIEVVVDSGAVQSVAPPGLFPGQVSPSEMSRTGRTFRAANGSRIRNLGQVRVVFTSAEGHKCSLPFQVAEVEHALLSVSHLTRTGNIVTLHDKGGRITNQATGKTMDLVRRGGIYILKLRVAGFPRQGTR